MLIDTDCLEIRFWGLLDYGGLHCNVRNFLKEMVKQVVQLLPPAVALMTDSCAKFVFLEVKVIELN